MKLSRRELLKRSALMTGLAGSGFLSDGSPKRGKKLKIGACDWSIGMRGDLGAFERARKIGLEGIQVTIGMEQDTLRESARQQAYLAESKRTGIKISSCAIGELNKVPYKLEPRTEQWVWDAVDVASNLDAKVILIPFFGKNDLRNDATGKKEVVRRLKMVAPKAEKQGVILGLESYLSAEELMDIIQQVGSKSIQVYYDFRNSADAGYDVIKEIQWLGKGVICELHMKETGSLLGNGTLDWKAIYQTLTEMGYYGDGWMQIESSRPKNADIIESYQHNHAFLKETFHY